MKNESLSEFAALDDIGFIGIAAGRKLSDADRAFFAQKGEEARQRYHAKIRAASNSRNENKKIAERFAYVAPVKQMAYA